MFGLTNGGTAGLIWGYLIVWAGYMLVFASIAEMASMYVKRGTPSIWAGLLTACGRAPTSGGQYHWVSEFAPRSCQRFISYIVGEALFFSNQECNLSLTAGFRLGLCSGMANGSCISRILSGNDDPRSVGPEQS